ncbi:unnamed protein product [Brugia timori]|nr:unnamed protein product [Brugia timori]
MRIIPEWKDYDAEIKALFDIRSKNHTGQTKSGHERTDKHTEL